MSGLFFYTSVVLHGYIMSEIFPCKFQVKTANSELFDLEIVVSNLSNLIWMDSKNGFYFGQDGTIGEAEKAVVHKVVTSLQPNPFKNEEDAVSIIIKVLWEKLRQTHRLRIIK